MSWTLVKKEEYPSFMKGMLVMLFICFWIWFLHPKTVKTEASSLSFAIACVHDEKPLTSILTEDILDSEPVKPKAAETKDEPDDESKDESKDDSKDEDDKGEDKGDKTDPTTTYTPTTKKEPEIDHGSGSGGIIVDGVDPIDDTIGEGQDGPLRGMPGVIPTTERDGNITTTTTQESQKKDNGTLQVRITRI